MALLRLLTNQSAMGNDVLSSREAWKTYQAMRDDERIQFYEEPFTLEPEWRKLTNQSQPTPKVWTDAYLAAFARAASMQLVTLDRAVLSIANDTLVLRP
jgi:predicted nucleic acid-binding protein